MNRNEARLAALLDRAGIPYEPQGKVAGHAVDFLVQGRRGPVAIDANGAWWHSKPKIVDCDRVKLRRLAGAGVCTLGVWDWRIVQQPGTVMAAVQHAIDAGVPILWDWAVPWSELKVTVPSEPSFP